jgi:hypothetical protein
MSPNIDLGSFINQVIITLSILGFYKTIKNKKQIALHFFVILPFIIFLLFAAYIGPWSGRLRDSFYPIIAVYGSVGAIYAGQYLRKKELNKKFFPC